MTKDNSKESSMLDAYTTILLVGDEQGLNTSIVRGARIAPDLRYARNDNLEKFKENVEKYFRERAVNEFSQAKGFRNSIIPSSQIQKANMSAGNSKNAFPFYISFDIPLPQPGAFAEKLEQEKYSDFFLRALADSVHNGTVYERRSVTRTNQLGISRLTRNKVWDFIELMDHGTEDFQSDCSVIGTDEDVRAAFGRFYSGHVDYSTLIGDISVVSELRDTVTSIYSDYMSLVEGKSRYSEVVAYRIAKYTRDDLSRPMQNLYFSNKKDLDNFFFLDTQVKINKNYFYKVFSYSIVLKEDISSSNGVVNRDPRVVLVEDLVHITDALVTSKPPTAPVSTFRSFIGEENKIQIMFADLYQKDMAMPIAMNNEEIERFQRIRSAQGVGADDPVQFHNDDGIKVYEIFRTTVPPSTPQSFSDKKWRRVLDREVLEKVKPDTTYYYMFRTIDNHGNVSNPSTAFEVTLVGGMSPYLIVNRYDYDSDKAQKKIKKKPLKRFLSLKPRFAHLKIKNTQEMSDVISSRDISSAVNKPELGIEAPKVWGNKYKIRVTSKKTGKKIDFNLEYDYNFEFMDE